MNARTIRRAAERKAAKLARQAGQPSGAWSTPNQNSPKAAVPPLLVPSLRAVRCPASSLGIDQQTASSASPAQIAANQANAQLSYGPTSETGKQISSQNALKTGLTGRTVLLPTDDTTAYQTLLDTFTQKHNPATEEERELVQSMADSTWRLRRIVQLEFAIYAKGSVECAEEFAEEHKDLEPNVRAQMIQVEAHLKYEKSLRNLNTQEARLQRRLAKDTAQLASLQNDRLQREAARQAILAARAASASKQALQPEIGFVFESSESSPDHTLEPAETPSPDHKSMAFSS